MHCAPIVTDRVAWSVGLLVGLSPSKPAKNGGSDRDAVCIEDSGGPRETPVAYSELLRANTIFCSFNTIQSSVCICFSVHLWRLSGCIFCICVLMNKSVKYPEPYGNIFTCKPWGTSAGTFVTNATVLQEPSQYCKLLQPKSATKE